MQLLDLRFSELTTQQLHDVLRLRSDVFVVEQECVYADVDGADVDARHLMLVDGAEVLAYLRVLDHGAVWHIGRVVTHPEHRGSGLSGRLVRHVLDADPGARWELEAQAYLVDWYAGFDFEALGDAYDLDGIPHVQMRRLPDPDAPGFVYDEFGLFADNARDASLVPPTNLQVDRISHVLSDGRTLSALRFGDAPDVVFLHGTAQNAHTWDTVVLALGEVNALCVDLAGHGHSSWRDDRAYDLDALAADVIDLLSAVATKPVLLVGMSLGGMVATKVAVDAPDAVARLVSVDITPGVTREKAKHIHDFIAGPQTFETFASLFERTTQFNPTRSRSGLHRGILHNAERAADGSWAWRYDRRGRDGEAAPRGDLWLDVEALAMPHLLVRGGADGSVVDDADVAELRRRRPASEVVVVDGAGHSVQGDRPLELAAILAREVTLLEPERAD